MDKDHINKIKHKLAFVIRRENLSLFINSISKFLIVISAVWMFFVLLELAVEFSSGVRTALIILFVLLLLYAMSFLIRHTYRFFIKPDYHRAAQTAGKHYTEIKDELLNTLQLLEEKNSGTSDELVDAAFKRIFNKIKNLDFRKIVNILQPVKRGFIALCIFIIICISILFVPALNAASNRLLNYDKDFIPTPNILFDVSPGNTTVTKGEDVTINVLTAGHRTNEIQLHTKSIEQTEHSARRLLPDSSGIFNYTVRNVRNSIDYFVSADKVQSETYKITVIDPPLLNKLEISIIPPAYSGLPVSFQRDNGNITALAGSNLNFSISSTKSLKYAELIFSDSAKQSFDVNGTSASRKIHLLSDFEYFISITDWNSNKNVNPIVYTLKTTIDAFPDIEIRAPENEVMLTESNNVPITLKIWDDYGFSKLILNYILSASKYEEPWQEFKSTAITINTKLLEDEVYYVWDLNQLVLAEGDVVKYYFEIYDNDNVNGPKSTKSKSQTIRVPSLDDLFTNLDRSQEDTADDLEQILEEANELREEFENLTNELKKDAKDISWEEKEKLEKALEKFEELTGKIDELKEKLSDLQNDAMQNNLLSKETIEKYNELQKLMDELGSDQLSEAFRKMQEMLQQLSRNQVQQSFQDLKANEQYFQKSIERTINLLKRIQIEQKVDELIKRAEDISEKLNDVFEKTDKGDLGDKQTSEELKERQKDITEGLNKIDEVMNDLAQKMSEVNDMPMEEMQKLIEEFRKQLNENLSENAEQNLQMKNKSPAMENQQQLSENMSSLSQMLMDLKQSIQQQNQMQVMYDMLKIIDNLILLSKDEEKLKSKTGELHLLSDEYVNNAQEQNDLMTNLDKVTRRMADLSQKTFVITPEMGNAVGKARWNMLQSINQLQNRRGDSAVQMQTQAMKYINEAALLMKAALDMMMSGGQGGGMMSLMQQLQQMANQQMNLNQLTKMLNQGNLSQQQMAQLQKLANEQALIRKSLAELNRESKESGQSKKLAGNLDKILDEMEEVVSQLKLNNVDDELILKQERILSRLLDAQRSMNERDFEEERESQTGTNIGRKSPSEIDLSSQEARDQLRDELIRALKEGYKKDYEDLIRKYFEALEKDRK
ncbi:DUF4175 family protein [Bacteroidota bacterium]